MGRKHWKVSHTEIRREVCGVIVYDLGEGPVTEYCEHGNEISDSKECGQFLSQCAIISFRRLTVLHEVSKLVIKIMYVLK